MRSKTEQCNVWPRVRAGGHSVRYVVETGLWVSRSQAGMSWGPGQRARIPKWEGVCAIQGAEDDPRGVRSSCGSDSVGLGPGPWQSGIYSGGSGNPLVCLIRGMKRPVLCWERFPGLLFGAGLQSDGREAGSPVAAAVGLWVCRAPRRRREGGAEPRARAVDLLWEGRLCVQQLDGAI